MTDTTWRDDRPEEDCGVVGVHGHQEAANLAYLGLHALQHRGQESAGIATLDGGRIHVHREVGLVQEAFSEETLARLPGRTAIGHVRYSTAGGTGLEGAQPLCADTCHGSLAVAHNGNVPAAVELRNRLERQGSIFHTRVDTEVLCHLVARACATDIEGALVEGLAELSGAYSMVVLTERGLAAARDPHGFRPLCLGTLDGAAVVASESCAFDLLGARFERDVAPGEVIFFDAAAGHRSLFPFEPRPRALCIFEHIYFARPDSRIEGRSVYAARRDLGRRLAADAPVSADVVVPVPDSGVPAAIGFAEASGIPFAMGLIRSHYVGRTFIEPRQSIRHFGVKLKLAPVREVLEGRRVAVVDDSIVRGTTARKIAVMLRDAGAREVHLRVSSPPTRWPCHFGIDTPSRRDLVAAVTPLEELPALLAVDSVAYLSVRATLEAVGGSGFCAGCFTGDYPLPVGADVEDGGSRVFPV